MENANNGMTIPLFYVHICISVQKVCREIYRYFSYYGHSAPDGKLMVINGSSKRTFIQKTLYEWDGYLIRTKSMN